MKKIVFILLSVVLILSLTACGESLEAAEVIEVNTAQDSETYVEGEDYQQRWNIRGSSNAQKTTMGETGYYYYTNLLYFHDFATDTSVPLCNQPNCQHSSEDCNAVLSGLCTGILSVDYYDGNLYVVGNESLDICVYRISADGSTRGKVGTILTITSGQAPKCIVHRGYVYCTIGMDGSLNNNAIKVYRMSLSGDGEAEVIYTFETGYGAGADLSAYGNYLYIQNSYYTDAEGNNVTGELYRYNIHTGETEFLIEDCYKPFAIDENRIYYATNTEVLTLDLETRQTDVLLESGSSVYFVTDGNYLYCDNEPYAYLIETNENGTLNFENRTITVIDSQSLEIVKTIPFANSSSLVGINGSNLLFAKQYTYYRLDSEKFISGQNVILEEVN